MIKSYCKMHWNNESLAIVMVYHVSNRFLKKKRRICLWILGIFTFQWVLAPSWQNLGCRCFVSAETSRTILSVDRSEPRFESRTGGKIRENLETMKIATFFVNFWLNQIQDCSVQILKMKDRIFSFQLKKNYFCRTLTDEARHENVPPTFDFTRVLKSYHKRNDRRKFPEK